MRRINKDKYVAAAIITLFIFLFGLILGLLIEGKRVAYIQEQGIEQKLVFESLQMQYLFIDQLGEEENCNAIGSAFDMSIKDLEHARERLEDFDKDSKISKKEFELLKKEYTLAQLRYWLLARKAKSLCDLELVTVLYFYHDDKVCSGCGEQAFILTYLKQIFKQNLLVFSLDGGFEKEHMIVMLKDTYNITKYPTLIFDDQKFEGLSGRELLIGKICEDIGGEACAANQENAFNAE